MRFVLAKRLGALVLLAALGCGASLARAEGTEPMEQAGTGMTAVGEGVVFGRLLEAGVECPQFEIALDEAGALAAAEAAEAAEADPDSAENPPLPDAATGDSPEPQADAGAPEDEDLLVVGERISLTGMAPSDLGPYQLEGRWSRFSYCMQGRSFDVRKYVPLRKP